MLGVACAVCLLLSSRGESLRVEVLSGSEGVNGPDECALLRFSDGSEVAIGAGALLRIAALRAHGAELQLEGGGARVEVAKRAGALWRLSAAGWRMSGSGASFDVDYSPARQSLSLALESGSLFVSGPGFQSTLEAGEHLSVDLASGRVNLDRPWLTARCSPRDAEPEREHQ